MGHVRREKRCIQDLVGKPDEKRSLGKLRSPWEYNIKMDSKDNNWEVVDWVHLAQDSGNWRAVVKSVMKFWVP
jgi:hypothetical protein